MRRGHESGALFGRRLVRFENKKKFVVSVMEKLFKMIVHVPVADATAVRMAIGNAGGGKIGNYAHCSFSVRGTGRFVPLTGAKPYHGVVGVPEEVVEDQIHVGGMTKDLLVQVVKAVRDVHPYEEPVIEIYEMVRV